MKKVSLFLGAIVLGFILTSCESKKDQIINMVNTFFDEEVAALNNVKDIDAFLAYFSADSLRYADFYDKLQQEFPYDSTFQFIGMSQKDSYDSWKVFDDRDEDYTDKFVEKRANLYDPYITEAENAFLKIMDFVDQYENLEDVPEDELNALYDQFLEKFDAAEKYMPVSDDDQYERYRALAEIVYYEEGAEENDSAE